MKKVKSLRQYGKVQFDKYLLLISTSSRFIMKKGIGEGSHFVMMITKKLVNE